MNHPTETADQTALSLLGSSGPGVPGLVLVFSAGEPLLGALAMTGELVLGRSGLPGISLNDSCLSRKHASLGHDGHSWIVTDLASRNGTYVDSERVDGVRVIAEDCVLRTGETLYLLLGDVRPFLQHHVETKEGYIVGPQMETIVQQVLRAANSGVLHVTGETGSGKEIAARYFHRFGPERTGPFVAVNCAAIPEGVAERLLFGAMKGAYSGADKDARGYVQEASGGTLFLDEIGELDLNVQAKLLRVLETKEVLPLGASRPKRVDIHLCSATHKDLRGAVAEGKFREDLFYRLGRPHVALPPLRKRREEIPFLIERQLRATSADLVAHAILVESCLLRKWPGNVRELLAEIRDAAFEALAQEKKVVRLSHLADDAGAEYTTLDGPTSSQSRPSQFPPQEQIEQALFECDGKVATAARMLAIHRNQLRRWLEKNQLDPKSFARTEQ